MLIAMAQTVDDSFFGNKGKCCDLIRLCDIVVNVCTTNIHRIQFYLKSPVVNLRWTNTGPSAG